MCRRLEKSIAYLYATGRRPTHYVGRGRLSVLGVDMQPVEWKVCTCGDQETVFLDDDQLSERPKKGTHVDSISYYTQELAAQSRALFRMQTKKARIADTGNESIRANNWFDKAFKEVSAMATQIMDDSVLDNDLLSPSRSNDAIDMARMPYAETMNSMYGSFDQARLTDLQRRSPTSRRSTRVERTSRLVHMDHLVSLLLLVGVTITFSWPHVEFSL